MSGFGHEAVVFRAALFDAGFTSPGAMGIEIAGDGQQHFLNHR